MPSLVRYALWTGGIVFGLAACGGGGDGDGTGPPTTGSVSGSVTDTGAVKSPLAGIATRIQGGAVDRSTITNAQGQYTFANLVPGDYTVSITVPDSFAADTRPTSAAVEVTADATSTVAAFELRLRVGTVTGTVTDDMGTALAGRQVFIRRVGAGSDAKPARTTGADGTYSFESVTIGNYNVRAQLVCGEPDPGPVAVTVMEDATASAPTLAITPRPSQAMLSCDVQPILQTNCALSGCHGTAKTPTIPDMEFTSASKTHETTVNVGSIQQPTVDRVEPGMSDQNSSYLVCKIEEICPLRGTTDRMPQFGPFLSASEIQTIKDWIAAGAQNN